MNRTDSGRNGGGNSTDSRNRTDSRNSTSRGQAS